MKTTTILAIDTASVSSSCALIKNGQEVVFNVTESGYIPNVSWGDLIRLLPRHHEEFIARIVSDYFKKAKIKWETIDAIAVGSPSGIFECLIAGTTAAKILARLFDKPLIEVDHILAHIYSTWVGRDPLSFKFPIIVFSSSGSHSELALIKDPYKMEIIYDDTPKELRQGVDNFVGVGNLFTQIGYRLNIMKTDDRSQQESINKLMIAIKKGQPNTFDFKKYYKGKLYDFNFLDFMRSIDLFLKKKNQETLKLPKNFTADVAASFQESLLEIVAGKIMTVAKKYKAKEIHIAGGVAANEYFKNKLITKIKKSGEIIVLRYPVKKEYCFDNAAMIGTLGYYQKKNKINFGKFQPKVTY